MWRLTFFWRYQCWVLVDFDSHVQSLHLRHVKWAYFSRDKFQLKSVRKASSMGEERKKISRLIKMLQDFLLIHHNYANQTACLQPHSWESCKDRLKKGSEMCCYCAGALWRWIVLTRPTTDRLNIFSSTRIILNAHWAITWNCRDVSQKIKAMHDEKSWSALDVLEALII